MVTQCLLIKDPVTLLFRLHSTSRLRLRKGHNILGNHYCGISSDRGLETLILTCPE